MKPNIIFAAALVGAPTFTASFTLAADSLPSWNDTAQKKAFIAFVERDQGRLARFRAGARAMKSNTV